jgi:hypothetical protein
VNAAIAARDATAFKTAYGALTANCNVCHAKAHHEFIQIKLPAGDPYPDQGFAPR